MKLREVTPEEFTKFAEKCTANDFLQSVEMYQRYKERGNETYLVGLFDEDVMKAASLLVSKRSVLGQKIFNAPRGFLLNYGDSDAEEVFSAMTRTMQNFLATKNAMTLVIAPNIKRVVETDEKGGVQPGEWEEGEKFQALAQKLGYKSLGEYEFARWIYNVPLEGKTEENLLKSFRADHKRTTKYAMNRYGMKLRVLGEDELEIMDAMSHAAGERNGFTDPGLAYYREMKKAYGDKVEFVVAEVPETVVEAFSQGDKEATEAAKTEAAKVNGDGVWLEKKSEIEMVPVASAMFVYWGNEVICLYSGSKDEYKKLGGPHLIRYGVILKAIGMGLDFYNFYHVLPKVGDGVYEFKRGYRGRVEEYIGTFMLPLSIRGRIFAMKQKYVEMQDVR